MKHTRNTINLLLVIAILLLQTVTVRGETLIVTATAYCNKNNNPTYSGDPTIEGVTVAGKKEWLRRKIVIYTLSENGSIDKRFGEREFTDTGYGVESKKYPGKGTIQTGETIDIFFEKYEDAINWGKRKVCIEFLED